MNIFSIFSSKKFMKICSKTHQIELFKKNSPGKHAPNPPSKRLAMPPAASSLAACNSPSPQKVCTPPPHRGLVPAGRNNIKCISKLYILPWTTTKKFT